MLSRGFRFPRCNLYQPVIVKRQVVPIEKMLQKPVFSKTYYDPTSDELKSYNKQTLDHISQQFYNHRHTNTPLPLPTLEKYLKYSTEAKDFHLSYLLLQHLQDHSLPLKSWHYEFALMSGTRTLSSTELRSLFSNGPSPSLPTPNYPRMHHLVSSYHLSFSPFFSPGFYTHLSQDLLRARAYGPLLSLYAHLQPLPLSLEPPFLCSVLFAMECELHPEVDNLFAYLLAHNTLPLRSFQDHLAYLVAIEEYSKFEHYYGIYSKVHPGNRNFNSSLLYLFLRKDKERATKWLLELKGRNELGNNHLRICLAYLSDYPSYALNDAIMAMFPFTRNVFDYYFLICYYSVYLPDGLKGLMEEIKEKCLFFDKEVLYAFLWMYNDERMGERREEIIKIPLLYYEKFPPVKPGSLAEILSFLPEISKIMSIIELLSPGDLTTYKITAAILSKNNKFDETILLYDRAVHMRIPREALFLRSYLTSLLNHPLFFTLKDRVLDCVKEMGEYNYDYHGHTPGFLKVLLKDLYESCMTPELLKANLKKRLRVAFEIERHYDSCTDYLKGNGFEYDYLINFIKNRKFKQRSMRLEKRRSQAPF